MPVYRLDGRSLTFPPVDHADPSGLVAIGGDFSPKRMLAAYASGIFPWSEYRGMPLWYAPNPRLVLTPETLHIGRSLRKILRRGEFRVTCDQAFSEVLAACAATPRPDQDGTWISDDYAASLHQLFEMGIAHSVEAWRGDELVGGLYGMSIGAAFFGESMFSWASNASKVAFTTLVRQLGRWGIDLIDCQVETDHLLRFGAQNWTRSRFMGALDEALEVDTRIGPWRLDEDINDDW